MEQVLQNLFLDILNMSITGSYVILFVIAIRLFLKTAPKIFSYGLWGVVLFRLLVPFSFSSALSFLGFFQDSERMVHIPADIGVMTRPQVDLGIDPISNAINGSLPAPMVYSSVNPLQIMILILSVIWLLGAAALLIYSICSYWSLKQRIDTAILVENNIYECETIDSPCVIGLIKPKIYLPYGLTLSEKGYILKHEQTHIRRFDHLLKPLAFLVLCIHWFNPLVWFSFLLMGRDMEMSCDENVLKSMGPDIKGDYSRSLLSFAAGRKLIGASPLTFGEQNAKSRIQNILNYRHPPMWIAVAILLLLIIASIGLLSNPESKPALTNQEMSSMAAVWAESLKTRDGELRYEIMSEKLQEEFIKDQKQRNDPWNFNIGVSSPWVTDYEITVNEDSAVILYHMTDSTQEKYDKTEIIHFGKENDKTVVIKAEELLSEWERYDYFAPTAEEAMQAYTNALLTSDYSTILSLTHSAKLEPNGQQIWDTIKISGVKLISGEEHDRKACYEMELTIDDGGSSAFEKGVFPRWLWLVKGDAGWYAEGLMTSGAPDSAWWNDDAIGGTEIDTFEFDELLYLSPLSSSTFDYAESRMKETKFTINNELFEIDYSNEDD